MEFFGLRVSWVDFAILLMLMVGVSRGRKRGMSVEFLDMIKWFAIVTIAGFVYEPAGRLLSRNTVFGLLSSYLTVYGVILLAIFIATSMIRQKIGDKLVSSDFFGEAEYYLGMLAGAFRYACILLVCMAFLNARYYTPQEVKADEKFQNDNFGIHLIPSVAEFQKEVFDHSLTGRCIRDYLHVVLIQPTTLSEREWSDEESATPARRRANPRLDK